MGFGRRRAAEGVRKFVWVLELMNNDYVYDSYDENLPFEVILFATKFARVESGGRKLLVRGSGAYPALGLIRITISTGVRTKALSNSC